MLNVNIKSEAQEKKLKTVRGSYTDLDLSIHAKKGPKKSRDTLPLKYNFLMLVRTADKFFSLLQRKMDGFFSPRKSQKFIFLNQGS